MILRLVHKLRHANALVVFCGVMIGCTAAFQASAQIPREDVLECGLPDGSKFVLKSKYKWYPQARLMRGDAAERLNQEPFHAEFKSKTLGTVKIRGAFGYTSLDDEANAESTCAIFGIVNGIPYVGSTTLMLPNEKSFIEIEFDERFQLFSARKENPEPIRSLLEKLDVYPSYGAITVIKNKMVSEQALMRLKDKLIITVFKSVSDDGGKTWGNPIVTTDAEIFVLGRTIQEQSFIARPVSVNGKKIETHFQSSLERK